MSTYTMRVYFTADITVKDGKYRIQFYDIDPKDETVSSLKISCWHSESIPTMIDYCYKGVEKKTYKRKLTNINKGFQTDIQSVKDALTKQTKKNSSDF